VIDTTTASAIIRGPSTGWKTATGGYGGSFEYALNSNAPEFYNWMRYFPALPEGWYEVRVYIPAIEKQAGNVLYWVKHARGYAPHTISQKDNANRWVTLGVYEFGGSSYEFVSLSTVTYKDYGIENVVFDAVQFIPTTEPTN
jgi:hypothetical protein